MKQEEDGWDIVIVPHDNPLAIDWREVWRYRDIFVLYVRRNFSTAYKQRILGPLWFIITPLMSIVVYVAVFGGIANIPTDGIPPVLFYLLGISVWSFFSTSLTATSNAFVDNAEVFGKVYFPRILMPLISVATQLLYFLIEFGIFCCAYIYYIGTGARVEPHWQCLLVLPLMLVLALLSMGLGMILTSVTTKYRDIKMLFEKLLALFVYVTPVIYPLSLVTDPRLHLAMSLNPVTPIMETLKYALLGAGSFSWLWLGYSLVMTLVISLTGLALFNKVQKSFMDTV